MFLSNILFGQCLIPNNFDLDNTCTGEAVRFIAQSSADTTLWEWDFGDPSSGVLNTYIGKNAIHTYLLSGNYTVKLTIKGNCGGVVTKNISIDTKPGKIDLNDTIICANSDFLYGSVIQQLSPKKYLWSTGDTTETIKIKNAGNYWLKKFNNTCYTVDTAYVKVWGQDNLGDKYQFFGNGENLYAPQQANVLNTNSSTSTISSPTGELICYTDGYTVYNKMNQVMENGSGLWGGNEIQSTIIIPDLRANNLYYCFNTSSVYGLNYSIIDLSYNLGLGKVVVKNIPMVPAASKIAAYYTQNTFYLIVQPKFSSLIYTYIINENGLNLSPKVSSVSYHSSLKGSISISNDGNKVYISNFEEKAICIYNFDKIFGTLTNEYCFNTIGNPLGLSVASNNKYLYTSESNINQIVKYNITNFNQTAIDTSFWVITNNTEVEYGSIKNLSNGQMAIAKSPSNYLDVIKSPLLDSLKVNYQENAIQLKSSINNLSLPNLPYNYFFKKSWGIGVSKLCLGDETSMSVTTPDVILKTLWSVGVSSVSVMDTTKTLKFKYNNLGKYIISCKIEHMCGDTTLSKTIEINEYPKINLGNDTLICGSSHILDSKNPQYTNLWNNGIKTAKNIVTKDSIYSVMVNNKGCIKRDTIQISFANFSPNMLGEDTTLCEGQSIKLYIKNKNPLTTLMWQNSNSSDTLTVNNTSKVHVLFQNKHCSMGDTMLVNVVNAPIIGLPKTDSVCKGVYKEYDLSTLNDFQFIWSTGDINPRIQTLIEGNLTVQLKKQHCLFYDSVKLVRLPVPDIDLNNKYSFCPHEQSFITIDIKGTNCTYNWTPNMEQTSKIKVEHPGVYRVHVKNLFGCELEKETKVEHSCTPYIYIPNAFSPNGDKVNDLLLIHSKNIESFEIFIFNKWGEMIFQTTDIYNYWDGIYKGQLLSEDTYTYRVIYSTIVDNALKQFIDYGNITLIK
jgi:gliding motility-associated-like protein